LKKTKFIADPLKDKEILQDLKIFRKALKVKYKMEQEMEKLDPSN
jgi:hypothetical protein